MAAQLRSFVTASVVVAILWVTGIIDKLDELIPFL
jgi:hypothetical protein